MSKQKIIDSILFFNELDLLELRLEELYDHVDIFLIVESDKTFTGKPKPLFYKNNRSARGWGIMNIPLTVNNDDYNDYDINIDLLRDGDGDGRSDGCGKGVEGQRRGTRGAGAGRQAPAGATEGIQE